MSYTEVDPATAITRGAALAKEVLADPTLHTVVVLKRYDAGNGREAMWGVHAYGDEDENGDEARSTVGLMGVDYRVGFVDAVHIGAKFGYWPAESTNVSDEVRGYILHNICPIEWHRKDDSVWLPRVDIFTRTASKPPAAPDRSAFEKKWGKK